MLSQNHVIQAFVSQLNTWRPATVATDTPAQLAEGEIGMFKASDNQITVSQTATDSWYFAQKRGNTIYQSPVITGKAFAWATATDLYAYSAPVAQVDTITIAASVAGQTYNLGIRVLTNNFNGDETKRAVVIAADATAANLATALVAAMNASLAKDAIKDFSISNAGAVITITALKQPFKLGRKPGGYTRFKSSFTTKTTAGVETALPIVLTTAPSNGRGHGEFVATKELLARQNSDAVSLNQFRTALPLALKAVPTGTYKTAELAINRQDWSNPQSPVLVPVQILVALQQ